MTARFRFGRAAPNPPCGGLVATEIFSENSHLDNQVTRGVLRGSQIHKEVQVGKDGYLTNEPDPEGVVFRVVSPRIFLVRLAVGYRHERTTCEFSPLQSDRRRRQRPDCGSAVIVRECGLPVPFREPLFETIKQVRL